jgi:hypothetical protein
MMRQHHLFPLISIIAILLLAGCSSSTNTGTTGVKQGTTATSSPTATITVNPAATATFGPPCVGDLWINPITSAGDNIPLPPQTISGLLETSPYVDGWVGHYMRLCTSGNTDYVNAFVEAQMPANGWSYGPASQGCICNGLPVWSRSNEMRFVQFDEHPNQVHGDVQWGVTVFSH